jgi:hypothetical protein
MLLSSLRDLSANSFTGTLPPDWGLGLSSVRMIKLASNDIRSDLPQEWAELPAVQHLDLSHNQLAGTDSQLSSG